MLQHLRKKDRAQVARQREAMLRRYRELLDRRKFL